MNEDHMKIKRYVASSMRAALGQARTELGPDAVILSNRRTEDGIEVIAAVDYDEGLFRRSEPSPRLGQRLRLRLRRTPHRRPVRLPWRSRRPRRRP